MPRRRRPRTNPRVEYQAPRAEPTTSPIAAPPGWTALRIRVREAGSDYVCPGCQRPVTRASEHVVAWREDEDQRRRHWHAGCWSSAVRGGIERYRFT